jgi:dolichol-phosphate mannosyltransferase
MPADRPNLTVILPTKREAENLPHLFRRLHEELDSVVGALEILVIDTPTGDGTEALVQQLGGRYLPIPGGFADALRTGFREATHDWLVTMDADGSHDPVHIRWMLAARDRADIVIASRYLPRAGQAASWFRCFTSQVLNRWLGTVCSLPVRDLSGGFKLYRKALFREFELTSRAFEIQSEIAIRAYGHGFRLLELPFYYHPRLEGRSKAAVIRYGLRFLRTSLQLRAWRNSRAFCDYDERAYNSRIPLQRVWQRSRHARIVQLLPPRGRCLDVGCGTDRLILGYPQVVGVDVNRRVLRYLGHEERRLVHGDAARLPFTSGSFDQAYCCEVAEHLPPESRVFAELARVLKPGGKLVVTTPDYGHAIWPTVERVYEALLKHRREGHAHLSRFSADSLTRALAEHGLRVTHSERFWGSILLVTAEKVQA